MSATTGRALGESFFPVAPTTRPRTRRAGAAPGVTQAPEVNQRGLGPVLLRAKQRCRGPAAASSSALRRAKFRHRRHPNSRNPARRDWRTARDAPPAHARGGLGAGRPVRSARGKPKARGERGLVLPPTHPGRRSPGPRPEVAATTHRTGFGEGGASSLTASEIASGILVKPPRGSKHGSGAVRRQPLALPPLTNPPSPLRESRPLEETRASGGGGAPEGRWPGWEAPGPAPRPGPRDVTRGSRYVTPRLPRPSEVVPRVSPRRCL